MINNSPANLLDLIRKFANLCLDKSPVSETVCYDINHIFKDGSRNGPDNYRGICISSAILKLITLIDKKQIGFKRNSRVWDHLLTLKTVVKKDVTVGENSYKHVLST